ncbi:hypothetical protein OEZ85_008858 [Tetradesmus obliquus]|uniref:Protein kinase domain-containing protein n=1 Tax=Tetradesmus obliquus TaxID=3088 RepID=A0ABY8TK15_TETOB|nr:hypothetical protein OEZ85_008858 [Tetradesmus obliquus]
MGQGASCFKPAEQNEAVDDAKGGLAAAAPTAAAVNGTVAELPAGDVAAADMQLLGRAPQPNLPMDVTVSGPPLPPCELDRLQVSQIPELLDAAPKEELQSILQLLCSMFHTQNALISLFADRRIYLVNCTGVFQEGDFPWRHSFCAWTMSCEHPTVMVVNDAQQDSRFCRNPYVTSKAVRSYLGAPLVSSAGHRLGTICFADAVPRVFDDNSVQIMCNFSELVTREIERDIMLARQQLQLDASASKWAAAAAVGADLGKVQLRSLECISSAVLLVDTLPGLGGQPVLLSFRSAEHGEFAMPADSAWAGSGAGCVLLTRIVPASTTTTSSSGAHSHDLMLASSTSSSGASHRLGSCSSVARAVCSKVEGLRIKIQIAAGSMGRVFRGEYFGTKVAVKVLDGDAVLRRDASSGLCLEALLGQTLQHPNIVRTMAWAVITGEERLPHAERLWGESLEPSKPSVALNRMCSSQAAESTAAAEAPALAAGSAGDAAVDTASAGANGCSSCGSAGDTPVMAASAGADGCASHDSTEQCMLEGQTWMVLEYCDQGCLQDAVDRGWLREGPAGPVSTLKLLATAAEIAAGMLHLHSQGIVHGDLSGFNVLLSSADPSAAVGQRGFVAKVADFGLSRTLTHGSKVVTKTYGTITHMPPEMLEHGICSKAADVYSFGVLLFQMAASSRAWAGLSHQAVVQAVCVQRLQLAFPSATPEAIVMLGEACLAHEPKDRPSFQDIVDVLMPLSEVLLGA